MAGHRFSVLLVAIAMAVVVAPVAAPASAVAAEPAEELPLGWDEESGIYVMIFPVDGEVRYSNTFGAYRSGCSRRHEGIDMMAAKMTPIVAVAAGTVSWMHNEQGGKCCAMSLNHDDGWRTWSIHMNNDTPGTDDGQGWGFAPGIAPGVHVEAGQHIGWVGDSGNAENLGSHLHVELHRPDGTKINPYDHLRATDIGETIHEEDILWLWERGIALPCDEGPDHYCPDDPMIREDMAAFMARALDLPDPGVDYFVDDNSLPFEVDINRIRAAGITFGCNPPENTRYCPGDAVSRGQMSAFLGRAWDLVDGTGADLFDDDDNSIFEDDIDRLGTAGITFGCNPPANAMFCRDDLVSRGQMASFIARALRDLGGG